MLGDFLRIVMVILLGVLFAYLYGFIEHGYIPPAEHLRLRFFDHFANYHIIMFGLFSALPLVVLVFDPHLSGVLLSFGLWTYLPVGEDIAWYHFAGTWPTPEDWTSWGGGYYLHKRWVPKWYLTNLTLTVVFFALALTLNLFSQFS
jgi:hypothetical protein